MTGVLIIFAPPRRRLRRCRSILRRYCAVSYLASAGVWGGLIAAVVWLW